MAKSDNAVYRVTEVIGTSNSSWEDAARSAVKTAAKSLRDLRIAEISKLDVKIENGKIVEHWDVLQVVPDQGAAGSADHHLADLGRAEPVDVDVRSRRLADVIDRVLEGNLGKAQLRKLALHRDPG